MKETFTIFNRELCLLHKCVFTKRAKFMHIVRNKNSSYCLMPLHFYFNDTVFEIDVFLKQNQAEYVSKIAQGPSILWNAIFRYSQVSLISEHTYDISAGSLGNL